MSLSTISTIHKLQASELPLSTVTVYSDRAELKRSFVVKLDVGLNSVLVEGVAKLIEEDSIRVDGRGNAIIHEVQFKKSSIPRHEVDTPQVNKLRVNLKELKQKKAKIEDLNSVYEKHLASINDVVGTLGKVAVQGEKSQFVRFDDSVVKSLDSMYGFHEHKSVELREKVRSTSAELELLEDKIQELDRKLNNLLHDETEKKAISITLGNDSKVEEEIELEVSYQVHNASWKPSYDVRVQAEEAKLKLFYYGNVCQGSGEDWNDVQLVLSTARPSSGGSLPKLGSLNVSIERPHVRAMAMTKKSRRSPVMRLMAEPAVCHEYDMSEEDMGYGLLSPELRIANVSAEEQLLSTNFNIPQRKSVPSEERGDTTEHKVTIAVLDLESVQHSGCVPSKNTDVFLTATAVNNSDYPLLAGEASIYVNNCFTSRVNFDGVNAGEKFNCPLGVNPAIKVQYKPVHEYHHQTGMISKSSIVVHEQNIVAKNTKSESTLLTIFEHIPKSTDEKIKVRVIAPEVKPLKPSAVNGNNSVNRSASFANNYQQKIITNEAPKLPEIGARLNSANNLEWTLKLSGNEEKEVLIKWEVEYPPSEKIEYNEAYDKQ